MSKCNGLLLLKRILISLIPNKYDAGEGVLMINKNCTHGKIVLSHGSNIGCALLGCKI